MTHALAYWTALLYGGLGAAAIAAGGGLVGKRRQTAHDPYGVLTALGSGFLVALGVLSALPEAYARASSPALALGVAAVAFALVLLVHRAGHPSHSGGQAHAHAHASEDHYPHAELSLHDARLAIAGLAIHALLDGVAVSAAVASQRELGFFVAFFVVLHKVPEGAAAAALTYAGGGSARDARRGVLCLALATVLGALTIFAVEGPALALALSVAAGVTAGVGVGIAGHLVKHSPRKSLLGILGGALLFALSDCLLHA